MTYVKSLTLMICLLLSMPPSAYSGAPSAPVHKKCLAAKDYKGCIEAQLPRGPVFNKAVAYEECSNLMQSLFEWAAAKNGNQDNMLIRSLSQVPVICNESISLQQEGLSLKSANDAALVNHMRRLEEEDRQRKNQFTRDFILPYIFGR